MSKAENIQILGDLVKNFVGGREKGVDNVFDLEDGFRNSP